MVYDNKLGIRLVAFIIDYLCLQIVSTFLINLGLGVTITFLDMEFTFLTYWQLLLMYIIYFVGFALFNNGVTIGKMIIGLKVVKADYTKLSSNKLLIREIVKAVFMPISLISFIVAIFRVIAA